MSPNSRVLFKRISEANDILLRTAADEDGCLIDKDAFEEKMHKYCSSCCSPSQQDTQNTYRKPTIPSIFLVPQDFIPYRVYEKTRKAFPKISLSLSLLIQTRLLTTTKFTAFSILALQISECHPEVMGKSLQWWLRTNVWPHPLLHSISLKTSENGKVNFEYLL